MTVAKPRKEGADRTPPLVVPSPNGAAGDRPPTFEERLEALEAVVQDLEGEELPLETSLQRYREGVEHLKACRSLLDDAERRLAELVAEPGPGGEVRVTERALEVGEKGLVDVGRGAEAPRRADAEKRPNGNHGKKAAPSCDDAIPF